jgi:hypothetical protein
MTDHGMTDRGIRFQSLLCRALYHLYGLPQARALTEEIEAEIGSNPESRLGWNVDDEGGD